MAKKNKKIVIVPGIGTCRECAHHYGDHELNYKGEPFLCLCKFLSEEEELFGKHYSKFLDHPCENGKFKKKLL